MEDYILKPIDDEKLTEVLAQAVRKLDEEDRSRAADMEEKSHIRPLYLTPDSMLLFAYLEKGESFDGIAFFSEFQDRLEEKLGIFTFLSISETITSYEDLQDCYKSCVRLQKYRMPDGYGSCVDEAHVENRTSWDVSIDSMNLRKIILKKDKEGAIDYIEDLFINNLRETVDVDVLYQLSLKIALVLQDIKVEYKLAKVKKMQDLTDMLKKIYQAEDIYGLKKIFIGEITDIITYLHTENSHYTPVVRQLMEEVAKNNKEDMNLKTLAYKYHMNASYASARGTLTAVNKNTEHPEKCVEFLNLLNTDTYLRNLLNYGIEGVHWDKAEVPEEEAKAAEGKEYVLDYKVKLNPEKQKDYAVAYFVQGGMFNTAVLETEPIDKWATFKEFNEASQEAPSFGFDFDLDPVSTEVAGFRNVLDEFGRSLYTGSVDPEEYLPKMKEKMEATGIQKVIDEMQNQINSWKSGETGSETE